MSTIFGALLFPKQRGYALSFARGTTIDRYAA